MVQIATKRVHTANNGIVDVPVHELGDSDEYIYEIKRTANGGTVGFLPLTEPQYAAYPERRIRTQHGTLAYHDAPDRFTTIDDFESSTYEGYYYNGDTIPTTNSNWSDWSVSGSGNSNVHIDNSPRVGPYNGTYALDFEVEGDASANNYYAEVASTRSSPTNRFIEFALNAPPNDTGTAYARFHNSGTFLGELEHEYSSSSGDPILRWNGTTVFSSSTDTDKFPLLRLEWKWGTDDVRIYRKGSLESTEPLSNAASSFDKIVFGLVSGGSSTSRAYSTLDYINLR